MKRTWKQNYLPVCIALLGCLGYCLRSGLYAAAVDEKNLLVRGHPLEIALWLCTAAAAVLILLDARKQMRGSFSNTLPDSMLSALGHIGAAAGILLTVLSQTRFSAPLMKVWMGAGLICVPLLFWGAFSRALGKQPFFGIYGACSIFLALYLVGNYQNWCANPQLQDYVFPFLGALFLMMFSYQQAAVCIGSGSGPVQRISGLAALYCCLVTVSGTENLLLYLGCGLWAGTSLCAAKSHRRKKAGEDHASS